MCLIVIGWRVRAGLPLVVAANRDEWRERPSEPARWWTDSPILAGRDLKAGGTWMGITREGRFAAVTNFRDPSDKRSTALSRGALVTKFLQDSRAPQAFAEDLSSRSSQYNAFNLLVGTPDSLVYFSSREGVPRALPEGVHGLSNHLLNEPWPKVVRARAAMRSALEEPNPVPTLFNLLSDPRGAPDASLPQTGVGLEWERRLAAPLITGADYGSRASTVMTLSDIGEVFFEERTLTAEGDVQGVSQHRFSLLMPVRAR